MNAIYITRVEMCADLSHKLRTLEYYDSKFYPMEHISLE